MNRNSTLLIRLLAVFLVLGTTSLHAGKGGGNSLLGYNVTAGTFTEITGGTVHATGSGIDDFSASVNLPFWFDWDGTDYNSVTVFGDGYVDFEYDNGDSPSALPGSSDIISAWYNDLTGGPNSELRTETLGTTGSRVFVIQWKNLTRSALGSSNDSYTFQIRLNESNGRADVVYGPMTITAAVGAQIGASSSNGGEITLTVNYWMNDWLRPYSNVGTESVALENWGPASGTTYRFGAATSADAGIVGITNPSGKFNANTNQTITAILRNNGVNPLDSVEILWEVNGVARTTIRYYATPELAPGEEVSVNLGTVNFSPNSFNTVRIWTRRPSGVNDQYPGNDEWVGYLAPRVSGRLNIALSGNPTVFPSFQTCVRHLFVSGISADVNVHVYNGSYDEQILIPEFDNGLAGGRVTFQNAAGTSPKLVWSPSNYPNGFYGSYESDFAQVTILPDAEVTFNGIGFELPNGLEWGGCVYGSDLGDVRVVNTTLVGPNNFLSMDNPAYAISLSGGPFTITDNTLSNLPYGISIDGTSGSQDVVTGNEITDSYGGGIFAYSPNVMVSGNTINGASGTDSQYGVGVYGAGTVMNNVIIGDVSSQTGSYSIGLETVSVYGNTSGPHGLLIANNMISTGAAGTALGLICQTDAGSASTRIFNNTVNITGGSGVGNSAAAYILGISPAQILNNIFHNYGTGADGGYAIFIEDYSTSGFITSMDFNNHMTTGTYVGYYQGDIIRNTTGNPLAAWRTATGRDNNSSSVAVSFVGGTDLHLQSISASLFGTSTTISAVNKDIDGETRLKPYMGADELKPKVVILEDPESRYACPGESFTLICVASITPGATVTYQWYKDGVKLNGETNAVLSFASTGYPASGVYVCRVEASDGTSTTIVESKPASIIVVRNTNIVTQPLSQPVALEGTVTLEVEAEAIGAPQDFVPQYQWKKRYWNPGTTSYVDTNVVDNGRITGSRSNRLTIREVGSVDTMDTYVCLVTGYCGAVVSKPARLFIPLVYASTNTPTACEDGPLNVECVVLPESTPGSPVSYQWYKGVVPVQDGPRVSGATTKALRITGAQQSDAGIYTCVATYDAAGVSITSNAVQVAIGSDPTITQQPAGDTVCAGETVTISTQGNGQSLSYQWFKGTIPIPGATQAAITLADVTDVASGTYSVVVTNPCGSVTSEVADLLVLTAPSISTQPQDVALYDGDEFSLTVASSGSDSLRYQWYRNDTAIAGANAATYTVDSAVASDQGTYRCVVSNDCGMDTSEVARVQITVGVSGDDFAETGYVLGYAIPNPSADEVGFRFTLPHAHHVRIVLTNSVGQTVAVLYDDLAESGDHALKFSAATLNLAPGVYNYSIVAGSFAAVQQVVVVR